MPIDMISAFALLFSKLLYFSIFISFQNLKFIKKKDSFIYKKEIDNFIRT